MIGKLPRTLTVFTGAAVLLNIVVGAGLLTLPGLAIREVGAMAPLAWLTCAVAALPLVGVLAILGARYPEPAGVAAYAGRALGRWGRVSAGYLLLSAVAFGLPSIALTGGYYLASSRRGSPFLYAGVLLLASVLPHVLPGRAAGRVMGLLASGVLAATLFVLACSLAAPPRPGGDFLLDFGAVRIATVLAPFTMLFFAFTGWEIGAGLAAEFKSPERDLPLAMLGSFALVTGLYVAVAWAAARVDLEGFHEAPFVAMVRPLLGEAGATLVAGTATLIIYANLSGAIWGVSRMVYGLALDGALPRALSHAPNGRPFRAVVATLGLLLTVLGGCAVLNLALSPMLSLAGQNFLLLYGLAALALLVLDQGTGSRLLAGLAIIIVAALLLAQGTSLLYPALIIALAAGVVGWQARTGTARGARDP